MLKTIIIIIFITCRLNALVLDQSGQTRVITSDNVYCKKNQCKSEGIIEIFQGDETASSKKIIISFSQSDQNKYIINIIELIDKVIFTKQTDIKITGQYSQYKCKEDILIIQGKPRLVNKDTTIDVAQKITLYNSKNFAKTSGQVSVKNKETLMLSDNATIYFKKVKDQKTVIHTIKAKENVRISTPSELIKSDKALYDPNKKIIKMMDNVIINRKNSKISGNYAIYDMETGISKMLHKNNRVKAKVLLKNN